jgi:hypothetical protein
VPNSKLRSVAYPWQTVPTANGVGVAGVIASWSGGAYDTRRDRLVVWGGGHFAYGGNEIYAFDVNLLSWVRVSDPSIPVAENTPYAQDGGPVSRHTYNTLQYVASVDRFCAFGSNSWFSQSGASSETDCYNFDGRTWERKANALGYGYESFSAYDPATGRAYAYGSGSGCFLAEWDPVADRWTQRSNHSGCYLDVTAAVDPTRRILVEVGQERVSYWDLAQTGTLQRNSVSTAGPQDIVSSLGNPGFDYDPVSDRFVAWNGGASVYTLDWAAKTWTRVTPAPTNSVTPPAPNAQGTFGRFRYVPSKNVFIVANDVDQNVFIYKLSPSSSSGTVPTTPSAPTVSIR